MLSCKEATKIASDMQERRLTLRELVGVLVHLMGCAACRAYRRQLAGMKKLFARRAKTPLGEGPAKLSAEARQRMEAVLRTQQDQPPSGT